MDTTEDNKDVQLLKEKTWTKSITIAEVIIIQRNQVIEEIILLKEIWKNHTREQEILKKLEKDKGQA